MIRCSRAAQPSSIRRCSSWRRRGLTLPLRQLFARQPAALDPLRQLHFLFGRQQRHTADFFQVQADRIVGIDIRQVIIVDDNRRAGFFSSVFFLGQLFFGRSCIRGFIHVGDAGAEQRGKGFFQLIYILLCFREESQDIINRHIGFLPTKLDQSRNRRMFIFCFFNPIQ